MLEVVRLLLNKVLQKQLKSTHLETGRVKKSPGKGFLAITALNHSNELTVLKSRDMGQEVKPQWRTVNQATEENCNQMSSAAAEEDCLATCRTATEHQQQRHAPAAPPCPPPAAVPQGQKRWVSSGCAPTTRVRLNASGLKFRDSLGCSRLTPVLWYVVCEP